MTRVGRVDVALDPETRAIIRGVVTVSADGAIEIRLPHRLESPNKTLHAHWRARTKDKQAWRRRLERAIADASGRTTVAGFERPIEALGLAPVRDRRTVQLTRLVPSSRNFIKDDDNLAYCGKHLLDQVRRMGFLRDDDRKWTDLRPTRQWISDDKRDWTVIRIEIPPGVPVPLPAAGAARTASER